MNRLPTAWQSMVMWSALTAVAMAVIAYLSVKLITLTAQALGYLQPLLIPVAVAAILAYLLDPVVTRITRLGVTRIKAVLIVFAAFVLSTALIVLWIAPLLSQQTSAFIDKVPVYAQKAQTWAIEVGRNFQAKYAGSPWIDEATKSLQAQIPEIATKLGKIVQSSVGGFLGIFGFLIGMVIVPIYLFYFLKDATGISKHWADYLPLRASHFRDEVVDVLTEINRYLIAFFRGQLLVSIVDGILIAIALLVMGLDFALLIGLMVSVLALIPYLGIVLCWIPAVLIAAVEFGDWLQPVIVTIIFIVVQQFEGWFVAPKIVGGSVGLHPVTVIISVFAWSLLIGGLLGAILAIPLTATLKVLLQRYIWHRRLRPQPSAPAV